MSAKRKKQINQLIRRQRIRSNFSWVLVTTCIGLIIVGIFLARIPIGSAWEESGVVDSMSANQTAWGSRLKFSIKLNDGSLILLNVPRKFIPIVGSKIKLNVRATIFGNRRYEIKEVVTSE